MAQNPLRRSGPRVASLEARRGSRFTDGIDPIERRRAAFSIGLLREVIAGDRRAQAAFFDEFAPQLLRRLEARYGGWRGIEVDDLLQDAFAFFLQHDARVLSRFLQATEQEKQTRAVLAGHLWDLACGIASNRRRSLRRRRAALSERPIELPPDFEATQVARDALARLQDCLRAAGSRVFLYFKLRFVEGLTPREVAHVTGWSLGSTYKLRISLNARLDACKQELELS